MPFNGGTVYANNIDPQRTRSFFRRLLTVYSTKYEGNAAWYGDQFAIANIVDLPFPEIPRVEQVERDGVRIALLPCKVYNYSPDGERPNLFDRNRDAIVHHFKG